MAQSLCYAESLTLDLTDIGTRGVTWKDVFDMGFRPSTASGTSAGVRNAVVTVKNGEKSFDLFPSSVGFDVFGGKNLVGINTLSKERFSYLTYEEADRQLSLFAEVFSDYGVVKTELQEKTYYQEDRFFETVQSSIGYDKERGYNVAYYLRRSGNKEKPFREMFMVSMHSSEQAKQGIRAKVAGIVPPEGYEHISLDPKVVDKDFLEAQKKKREAYRKKWDAEYDRMNKEALEKYRANKAKSDKNERSPKPLPAPPPSEADKPNSFPWWLLGFVGLIVVLGFLLLKGKSK